MKKTILLILTSILGVSSAYAQPVIPANQAQQYVGQYVTTCGILASSRHFQKVHLFNLDQAYPRQSLTISIFNNDYYYIKEILGDLDRYTSRKICATGVVKLYKGKAEIIVRDPANLKTE
ncbi:MAG: hypothetical protein KGV48_003280 [Alcaligenaceae bacterium]|nr:hypothetical protein [Alcaligenaceae bacterium]